MNTFLAPQDPDPEKQQERRSDSAQEREDLRSGGIASCASSSTEAGPFSSLSLSGDVAGSSALTNAKLLSLLERTRSYGKVVQDHLPAAVVGRCSKDNFSLPNWTSYLAFRDKVKSDGARKVSSAAAIKSVVASVFEWAATSGQEHFSAVRDHLEMCQTAGLTVAIPFHRPVVTDLQTEDESIVAMLLEDLGGREAREKMWDGTKELSAALKSLCQCTVRVVLETPVMVALRESQQAAAVGIPGPARGTTSQFGPKTPSLAELTGGAAQVLVGAWVAVHILFGRIDTLLWQEKETSPTVERKGRYGLAAEAVHYLADACAALVTSEVSQSVDLTNVYAQLRKYQKHRYNEQYILSDLANVVSNQRRSADEIRSTFTGILSKVSYWLITSDEVQKEAEMQTALPDMVRALPAIERQLRGSLPGVDPSAESAADIAASFPSISTFAAVQLRDNRWVIYCAGREHLHEDLLVTPLPKERSVSNVPLRFPPRTDIEEDLSGKHLLCCRLIGHEGLSASPRLIINRKNWAELSDAAGPCQLAPAELDRTVNRIKMTFRHLLRRLTRSIPNALAELGDETGCVWVKTAESEFLITPVALSVEDIAAVANTGPTVGSRMQLLSDAATNVLLGSMNLDRSKGSVYGYQLQAQSSASPPQPQPSSRVPDRQQRLDEFREIYYRVGAPNLRELISALARCGMSFRRSGTGTSHLQVNSGTGSYTIGLNSFGVTAAFPDDIAFDAVTALGISSDDFFEAVNRRRFHQLRRRP